MFVTVMSDKPTTALGRYLSEHGITQAQFAEQIGCTQPAVARYVGGRVPEAPILKRIVEATGGEVQPNDFFDLPDESPPRPFRAIEAQAA